MVEDKYSKNLRTSKQNETYSYMADLQNQELIDKVKEHYEKKSKELIELGDYFWFPIQFTSKEDGKLVQMIYRFVDKEKALEKASGSGNKQYAPKKEYYKTFEEAIPVGLTDYAAQADHRAKGKQVLTAEMLGTSAVIAGEDGKLNLLMGKVFKVEL